MGMHDTGRYRQGQGSAWRAYEQMRDDRDPPREGSDLRYGLNGGYGQETWADDDASWPDEVREDDWGELLPHRFGRGRDTRDRMSPYQRGASYSDTHYDELRSDRRYWTDPGYARNDRDTAPESDRYRDDARSAFSQADDRYFDDRAPHERGMLYNLGHRIGEVLGEWFGSSDAEPERADTRTSRTSSYPRAYSSSSSNSSYSSSSGSSSYESDRHSSWTPERRVGPRNYKRSDERIRDEICERLTFASGVNVREVSVDVSAGVVTLTGTVERRAQKYDIEDIADNTSGVTEVDNQIRVQHQPTDAAIAAGFNGS